MIRMLLEEIINDKGFRQKYIADKMKVSEETVTSWKKGRTFPRLNEAVELAKILGVEITDLYIEE